MLSFHCHKNRGMWIDKLYIHTYLATKEKGGTSNMLGKISLWPNKPYSKERRFCQSSIHTSRKASTKQCSMLFTSDSVQNITQDCIQNWEKKSLVFDPKLIIHRVYDKWHLPFQYLGLTSEAQEIVLWLWQWRRCRLSAILKRFLSLLSSMTKASKTNYHLTDLLLSSTPSWWKMHWHYYHFYGAVRILLMILLHDRTSVCSSDDIAMWSCFGIFVMIWRAESHFPSMERRQLSMWFLAGYGMVMSCCSNRRSSCCAPASITITSMFIACKEKKRGRMQQQHKEIRTFFQNTITKCSNHNSSTSKPARCHQTHTGLLTVQCCQTCPSCFQQL